MFTYKELDRQCRIYNQSIKIHRIRGQLCFQFTNDDYFLGEVKGAE